MLLTVRELTFGQHRGEVLGNLGNGTWEIGAVQKGMEGEEVKKAIADNSLPVLLVGNGAVAEGMGGVESIV